MEALPNISCIMPTYGRPAYVNESVAMFLEQDYPHKELIILNDCVGQRFNGDFPNVRIINRDSRFTSLGEKRNECIRLAKGPILAVWDDDDVYLPWRLSFSWHEMSRLGTPFYRPAEFWAYWGGEDLHDNQSVPGWLSHAWVMFSKELWEKVGGYPLIDWCEDAQFFERIHQELGETFIKYDIAREYRFAIMRGTSQYQHMSIDGGKDPLDTTPGIYQIAPAGICDPILRTVRDHLVATYRRKTEATIKAISSGYKVVLDTSTATAVDNPAISICISLKNRSRVKDNGRELMLFPNCVSLLAEHNCADLPIELVVSDFLSEDWPPIEWIERTAVGMPVRVIAIDGPFSRGRGLNLAVAHARSDHLLLFDADLLVSVEALQRAVEIIDSYKAWFPTWLGLDDNGTPDSWQDFTHGLVGIGRTVFNATGGVPEFRSWGGEDVIFAERVSNLVPIVRERFEGIFHQWHPEWCRHENYQRPRQADYYDYGTVQTYRESMQSGLFFKAFLASHPHWVDSSQLLLLLSNGRMERPGGDEGGYKFEEEKYLVLNWDRWPPEKLVWDEKQGIYLDTTKPFTLTPVAISMEKKMAQYGFRTAESSLSWQGHGICAEPVVS